MKKFGRLTTSALAVIAAAPGLFAQGPPPARPGTGASLTLSPAEASRLTWMREEEKLARDVYEFLGAKWNLRIFQNIGASETRHFTQVGTLLARYRVGDPAAGKAAGEYWDPRIAALYAELTTKGGASIRDALEAGVLIETKDIEDLQAALTEATHTDIKRVYTNLLNASFNHLETFEGALEILLPQVVR